MRFHIVALPHTQVTRAYSNCAFTENTRKLCDMMSDRGHEVILYAGEETDAKDVTLVPCVERSLQVALGGVTGPENIISFPYQWDHPLWKVFRARAITGIRERLQDGDIIAVADGWDYRELLQAFPSTARAEFAIGYTGISHVPGVGGVWPSYAWMHAVYGRWHGSVGTPGKFEDRVIPHSVDLGDLPCARDGDKEDYLLFVGRLNTDKGVQIAATAAREAGVRLVVAGQGPEVPEGCDYRGLVGVEERSALMRGARGVFVPSLYLEPFGMVAVEALASGTPIITTDWGGLTEINQGGVGFRCHSPAEFADAAKRVDEIDPAACRARAEQVYSMDVIGPQYEAYFKELATG